MDIENFKTHDFRNKMRFNEQWEEIIVGNSAWQYDPYILLIYNV